MILKDFLPFNQNGNFSLKELFMANGILLLFVVGVCRMWLFFQSVIFL